MSSPNHQLPQTLTFALAHEDVVAAANRPRPWSARARVIWLVGITVTAFVLGLAWDLVQPFFEWAHPLENLTVALFALAAWTIPAFALSLTAARRRIQAARAPTVPTELKLFADRIEITGQGARTVYSLTDLARPQFTNERIFIDAGAGDTLIIPLTAFADKDAYLAFANLLTSVMSNDAADTEIRSRGTPA